MSVRHGARILSPAQDAAAPTSVLHVVHDLLLNAGQAPAEPLGFEVDGRAFQDQQEIWKTRAGHGALMEFPDKAAWEQGLY